MKVKLLYTLSFLVLFVRSAYAIYVPIQFSSGLNQDIIANGTGNASENTTVDMDDISYDLVCQNFWATSTSTPLTFGLPASGLVNSAATRGVNYQFSPFATPYTGNNTFNAIGIMVYRQKSDSDNIHRLSVTGFANGNYFVRVLTDKGFINLRPQIYKEF